MTTRSIAAGALAIPAVPGAESDPKSAAGLAERAKNAGLTISVAESLTAGNLAATLGAAPDSADRFSGGVVAYSATVKQRVLDIPDVPVVSATAAQTMAANVRALMDTDLAVATTGVGGPGPQDGEPPGSVWFAVATRHRVQAEHRHFGGDPQRVLEQTVRHAIGLLLAATRRFDYSVSPNPWDR
ncbi:CinA family protein [Nocardia sp. CA-128927]|uniref:CinA family protein n=1 Tax=Nocardia sp. CA-128927 TaxID=3239975 RepID=UPI003D964F60